MVSARLGHEDIGITLKFYAHVMPDDQSQATAVWDKLLGERPTEPRLSHHCPTEAVAGAVEDKKKRA